MKEFKSDNKIGRKTDMQEEGLLYDLESTMNYLTIKNKLTKRITSGFYHVQWNGETMNKSGRDYLVCSTDKVHKNGQGRYYLWIKFANQKISTADIYCTPYQDKTLNSEVDYVSNKPFAEISAVLDCVRTNLLEEVLQILEQK